MVKKRDPLTNQVIDSRTDAGITLEVSDDFRNDDWINSISGVGTFGKDKRTHHLAAPPAPLCEGTLDYLYHGNSLAYRICRLPAVEVLRSWITFRQDTEEEGANSAKDLGKDVHAFLDKFRVRKKFTDSVTWSRLYGSDFLFMVVDDGRSIASPLDTSTIKEFLGLTNISRSKLHVNNYYEDPLSPKFGMPKTYQLQRGQGDESTEPRIIHESRLLRFDGTATSPTRMRDCNDGFADSTLVRMYSVLRGYGMTWDSVEVLMQDFAQAVIQIKDLHKLHQKDKSKGGKVATLLSTMMHSKSTLNAVVLGDGDSYVRQSTPLQGMPEILSLWMTRVAAAAEMPVTLLFGESPGGLNATGVSDERIWAGAVSAFQEDVVRPNLQILLEVILNAPGGPTNGTEPTDWSFEFNPLRKPTAKDSAELRKLVAETDAIYYDRDVVTNFEIALSRWGGDKYSTETKVDIATREELMDTEEDLSDDEIDNVNNSNGTNPDPNAGNPKKQ